ncbi:MAG: DNA topoisomerase I [Thermoplasmata archaeon]|nr:MAG: DNA topoisomerase I [Thermoplasmata archaeon]
MKLVICEKQIAAGRIASILSNGKAILKKAGKMPYYTFTKDGEEWIVLGLKGHIVNLDYPPEFNRWKGISPLDLIWIEPYKRITNKAIADILKMFADKASEVIIATDFDREGELIGVEAIEILRKYNKNLKNIKRARFSALTRSEIISAFSNLVDIDYNLAKAAETRQIIDLVWGATLTRFVSMAAKQYGKDFLSIGRVQSPTLAMIVDREKQIKEFVPEPYWQIAANLEKDKTTFSALHKKDKIKNEEEAKKIYEKIKDVEKAFVSSVNRSIKKELPPTPFDTTSFLNAASSILKLSASRAMEIAEELYMQGWISYPRTDNTVYPKSLRIDDILHLLKDSAFSDFAEITIKNRRKMPTRGKKETTDHPPIHPVDIPPLEKLTPEQKEVYALIVKRFLATLTKDATAEITNAEIEIKREVFVANGYRLIEPTWKLIYPTKTGEKEIPELRENEEIDVKSVKLLRKETKPPRRFTQGALISEMEKLGLGTKSTRHEIIKKLYSRKYIIGSTPIPTATAFAVVDTIRPYDISKPDMTAQLEKDMDNIAEGKEDESKVIKKSREMLHRVLTSLENNKHAIRSSLRKALTLQNTIGTCPSCGKPLVVRTASKSKKRFVGCTGYPNCKVTYPLPQKGRIIPTDKKCPVCGAPIIKINKKEMCINPDCPSKKR